MVGVGEECLGERRGTVYMWERDRERESMYAAQSMCLLAGSFDIFAQFPRLLRIDERRNTSIAPASANGDPDMLLGCACVHHLAESSPAKTSVAAHGAVSKTTIGHPFLDHILNEHDLASEVVGIRYALEFGVNLGPLARGRRPRGTDRGWLRLKVEERLQRVREHGTIVESSGSNGPFAGKHLRGFFGEMPEVAPGASSIQDNLGVIGEVELDQMLADEADPGCV